MQIVQAFPRTAAHLCLFVSLAFSGMSLFARTVHAKVGLGVSSSNYLGQGSASRQESYSSLDVELDLSSSRQGLETRAVVQSLISFNDSNYRFIEAPELWLGNSKEVFSPVQFSIGRKREAWSKLDSEWALGIWQPRFRWDYLRPETVGLAGFHVNIKTPLVQAWAMASPLYVPDRGAPLDFADGRLQSISPWVLSPPYFANVFDRRTEIRYDAKIPEMKEIVSQPNYSARARVGGERGFWASASYAYKPMNQLLMSYDAILVNTASQSYVEATVYPRVSYHHLAAFDAGYASNRYEAWLSVLADRPRDTVPTGPRRTSQVVNDATLVSPSFTTWFAGRQSKVGGKATMTYLRKFGKESPDQGRYQDGGSAFESRYPFENALLASARSPQWRKFTTDLSLLYDLKNPGTVVTWLFQYDPTEDWQITLSTDVLTSWTDEGNDDFIQRYRANDRIMGGVTYVF